MKKVFVSGGFENLKSIDIRFLQQAAQFGQLTVLLWSDKVVQELDGTPVKFPQQERMYFLKAVRYVSEVILVHQVGSSDQLPAVEGSSPDIWIVTEADDTTAKRSWCAHVGIQYLVLRQAELKGFPTHPVGELPINRKKVVVTGCFDWLHSGHVRFFEETSRLGDLYVVVGHDENIRLLKGEGHPMYSEKKRRYMVGSIRYVKQALISSGEGWMDAEPEIQTIQPDIYAVNEDGDKPEKRKFCEDHGIEYMVLKRTPKEGLPRRESTRLRGF